VATPNITATSTSGWRTRWVPQRTVVGVPYDTPILGYHVNTANTLRLWRAEATESFDFSTFNRGDYYGAVNQKVSSENLTKVLYPNDEAEQGKGAAPRAAVLLRLLFAAGHAAHPQDPGYSARADAREVTAQLNDTHPAIAVAELMRLLIDENAMDWDTAWAITRKTFAYTNHTLLPEALERWPLSLFRRVLPRHMEIVSRSTRVSWTKCASVSSAMTTVSAACRFFDRRNR